MAINDKIRAGRKKKGLTQEQLAQQLGIKRSLLGAYEEGRAEPRLELLQRMADLFQVGIGFFLDGDTPDVIYERGSVSVVTIDRFQRENIEWVPAKAAAGYLNGYGDPEFVKELPRFSLPQLPKGTYRAFEITGDSMLPILPGTVVVGEYVESLRDLKNGKTYVLVTRREGVVYKRVFNYLDENGKLFLVSDNRQYAPYQIEGEEVMEAWAAKAYISVQFPDAQSRSELTTEQLTEMILDLKEEIRQLRSEKGESPPF